MADPVTVGAAVGWGISAVGWVVSPIISKLLNKGFSYLGFNGSVRLKELEDKVLQLELIREVVEESPYRDRLENSLKELRSTFYEAEDFLDDVQYDRVERQILSQPDDGNPPRKRKWGKMLQPALLKSSRLKKQESGTTSADAPLGMSKRMELKKILKKIENSINKAHEFLELLKLSSHFQRLHLQTGDANACGAVTTAAPPQVVIGRDEDRDKIIAMLHETVGDGQQESNSALPYSIIGIYGIPGSGKSTLAQHVCAHEENGDHFDLVMWVQVLQNFSVQAILSEMIEQAEGKPCPQYKSLNALQKYSKEELRGKRFLLVLDDVWYNEDAIRQQELQQILSPLRVGKAGSKILVTGRTSNAVEYLGAVRCIPISDLDGNVFLKLFMHYALEGARIDDQNRRMFEMIGADIAKKLKRSPLAARTVGGQLRIRLNVEFWRSVRDRDLLNETMGALWWSYQHLDEQVRRCFAYCSMFPRRHQLKRDELVNLWVAEGFIKISNAGKQIEDIGQSYFHELVSCSFLQQTGRVGDSDTVCFTIHDLLYDLAERVAGSDCFTVLKNTVEIPPTVRHLYIDSDNAMEIAEQICKLENLRTLIYANYIGRGITERVLDGMLNKLRRLRIVQVKLDSEGNNYIAIPASIGNLKHLRCLSIYDNRLPVVDLCLPSTFDKLYHLQILEYPSRNNLRCSCVRSINNLINLRHVKSTSTLDFFDDDHEALEIPGIGRLKSLQTLCCFGVRKEKGYELQQLEGLNHLQGILRIIGLGNVESKEQALEAKLADKEGLTALALEYGWAHKCPPDLQADILEGLRPPSSVTQLRIHGYHSRRYPSWLLGNQNAQRNLQRLQLDYCHELEDLPEIGEIFIHLHELRLESLRSLKSLPRLPENLKKLVIERCTSLSFICVEDVDMLRTMLVERAYQADPSLSVNPEGIAGFSPEQCDRFKATLYDLIRESGNSNLMLYSRCSYNLMLENVFPLVGGNCIEEDSQFLIPRSVEHLRIGLCTITDSALRYCLIGCTSITCLKLSGILCLTAIPLEFLTRLRGLSITECVALIILHGLNDLRKLENLTIRKCPNLMALQDSEKVAALRSLTVDDLSLVPDLLSTEGRSSLTKLRIEYSKERKEAEFLQQLTSLISLQFRDCKWDTLPENLVHLTSLGYMEIRRCDKIQSLPVLPESLEYFEVGGFNVEFMDSCRTPGDPNWQKIEHVPTIIIGNRRVRARVHPY